MEYVMETHRDSYWAIPTAAQLAEDLEEICAAGGRVSFISYDIHSLRKINRAYGRKVGSALLAAVAAWTRNNMNGTLYRVESDQFCVLFKNADIHTVKKHACNLEARFGKPWKLNADKRNYDIFAKVSVAILADYGCDFRNELLELLDQALEISKKEQRVIVFTAERDRRTREHVRLQLELKSCILSGMKGFYLEFQPLVDPVTSTWRGLEALCRWKGPTLGQIPPEIFIEEVEETGLIHQMGTWVLNQAIETCKALRLDEIDRFFVSVNVSALQINRRNYVHSVVEVLQRHHYPADKLMLEITESTQFSFNEATMETIVELRARGVMFALDDFGSGYSGFSNLKNQPVDMLKTGREFTENIENDANLQYFYYIMSETARANAMQLIAEEVETQEQLQSVVKNGAGLVQGYLFGRPMSAEAIGEVRDKFTTPLPEFSANMRGQVDFERWMNSQHAYKITPALFSIQSRCIGHILDEDDVEVALCKIMETVGVHFKMSRVYVFLREKNAVFSQKYEWCAEGIASQKHLFQKMDGSQDGFYEVLQANEVILVNNEMQLPDNIKSRLDEAGRSGTVQSIVSMPMKQRGEILGFVGYDSLLEREWMPEELIILHNLCLLCLIVLARNEGT